MVLFFTGCSLYLFVVVKHKLTSVAHVSVLLLTMNFAGHNIVKVAMDSRGYNRMNQGYFDNIIIKFMIQG